MNKERTPDQQENENKVRQDTQEKKPRSSAFNEPVNKDRKQTSNAEEEEADLEQQRKDAMTERD